MSWQDDLRSAISTVVLRKGRPVTPYDDDNYSSWVYGNYHDHYREIRQHAKTCPFAVSGEVKPVEWSEFQDTEAPNLNKHGLTAVASCACGLWENITWLYEEDLGTVLKDLLEATPPDDLLSDT